MPCTQSSTLSIMASEAAPNNRGLQESSRDIAPARCRDAIRITDEIAIYRTEIEERFVRASGPGGQHVNNVIIASL